MEKKINLIESGFCEMIQMRDQKVLKIHIKFFLTI
jgi:hypothetical protein